MKTITIKLPEIEDCEFTIEALPEDQGPEGSFASGDDDQDAEDVARIIQESQWNEWAWCVVKVTCEWRGITGEDYLGGCNYESREQFMEPGGYFDDMKQEAFRRMVEKIESMGGIKP